MTVHLLILSSLWRLYGPCRRHYPNGAWFGLERQAEANLLVSASSSNRPALERCSSTNGGRPLVRCYYGGSSKRVALGIMRTMWTVHNYIRSSFPLHVSDRLRSIHITLIDNLGIWSKAERNPKVWMHVTAPRSIRCIGRNISVASSTTV